MSSTTAGTASRYTRSRLPVSVAYQEAQVTPKSGVETGIGDQGDVTAAKRGVDYEPVKRSGF